MQNVDLSPTMRETLLDWAGKLLDAHKIATGQPSSAIFAGAGINKNWLAEAREQPRGFNVAQYDRLSLYLRQNWQEGTPWPEGVPVPPAEAAVPDTPARRHRKFVAAGGLRGCRAA